MAGPTPERPPTSSGIPGDVADRPRLSQSAPRPAVGASHRPLLGRAAVPGHSFETRIEFPALSPRAAFSTPYRRADPTSWLRGTRRCGAIPVCRRSAARTRSITTPSRWLETVTETPSATTPAPGRPASALPYARPKTPTIAATEPRARRGKRVSRRGDNRVRTATERSNGRPARTTTCRGRTW